MIKLLVIIYNNEKILKLLFQKYNLGYKVMSKGDGTASSNILEYLGLNKVKRQIYYLLIDESLEESILKDLKNWCKLENNGKGIAFTISLSSSSKFIKDNLGKEKLNMPRKGDYELIITIVSDGYSDLVMKSAHSKGCMGGTVIKGRSVGSHGTIFMDFSLEPEKEMVLNIVKSDIKKDVMEKITEECGIKTNARGVLISIPLDNVIGLQDSIN